MDRKEGYKEEIISKITSTLTLVQYYISSIEEKNDLDCKDLFRCQNYQQQQLLF